MSDLVNLSFSLLQSKIIPSSNSGYNLSIPSNSSL